MLEDGQIVFLVKSQVQTNQANQLVTASIGMARIADTCNFGYLSEYHALDLTKKACSKYSEDLAASMLASYYKLEELNRNNIHLIDSTELRNKKNLGVTTKSITQSAVGKKNVWTTVVSAAVMIL